MICKSILGSRHHNEVYIESYKDKLYPYQISITNLKLQCHLSAREREREQLRFHVSDRSCGLGLCNDDDDDDISARQNRNVVIVVCNVLIGLDMIWPIVEWCFVIDTKNASSKLFAALKPHSLHVHYALLTGLILLFYSSRVAHCDAVQ